MRYIKISLGCECSSSQRCTLTHNPRGRHFATSNHITCCTLCSCLFHSLPFKCSKYCPATVVLEHNQISPKVLSNTLLQFMNVGEQTIVIQSKLTIQRQRSFTVTIQPPQKKTLCSGRLCLHFTQVSWIIVHLTVL